MADRDGAGGDDLLIDLDQVARPGPPPVAGAQWDELNERWEFWDEGTQAWHSVGSDGQRVSRSGEARLPDFAPREGQEELAADPDEPPPVIDLDRFAEPEVQVVGAQWNEVKGRWERWDEDAATWVEARVGAEPRADS